MRVAVEKPQGRSAGPALHFSLAPPHTPLRVNDCQSALEFESANLRKNRRPQRRRPPPLAWVAVQVPTSAFTYSYLLRETEADTLSLDKRNTVG